MKLGPEQTRPGSSGLETRLLYGRSVLLPADGGSLLVHAPERALDGS